MILLALVALYLLFADGTCWLTNISGGSPCVCNCECNCVICASPQVQLFASAIAVAEGFGVNGSRPQRNNNPGDLRLRGDMGLDCQGYGVFSSVQAGYNALYRLLNGIINGKSKYYSLCMSIGQMASIYAPSPNPANWATNVADTLGGSPSDSLRVWLT